jgi:hypothetical protein
VFLYLVYRSVDSIVLTYLDLNVLAFDSANEPFPYILTSPNASLISLHDLRAPQPLRLRADGCFGVQDCFQYPQAYSTNPPRGSCITRKPTEQDFSTCEYVGLCATHTKASFVLEKGCAFGDIGRIEKPVPEVLEEIQHNLRGHLLQYQEERRWIPKNACVIDFSMKSMLTRLQDCPVTFRDVIVQFLPIFSEFV